MLNAASSFEGSRRLTSEYIRSGEPFTAVLAFDDISAFGAIRALSESGRRVPDDCSVTGFDDIAMAALSTPGLTTVRQPMMEMGEYAAECILNWLGHSEAERGGFYGQHHTMSPELAPRESTAARGRQGDKK